MKSHFESWYEFATQADEGPGLRLSQEEIMFVSGTVKTARWSCSAFSGEYRHKEGSITCDISGLASAEVSLSISNHVVPKEFTNFGPLERNPAVSPLDNPPEDEEGSLSARAVTEPSSSPPYCIFIHYFKYRKRLLLSPEIIQAAAGPHLLPPDSPEREPGAAMISMEEMSSDDVEMEEVPASLPLRDQPHSYQRVAR